MWVAKFSSLSWIQNKIELVTNTAMKGFLPHELIQLISRLFNFDLTSMEQTNDIFFPLITSRFIWRWIKPLECMQIPAVTNS